MSEEVDLLKEIGVQEIHEQTHISVRYVKSILDENFNDFSKVQFLGFIAVLQREYKYDLSALKARGLAYFDLNTEQKSVFIEPKRTKKPTLFYGAVVLLIFVIVAYISIGSSTSSELPEETQSTEIQNVQKNLEPVVVDENRSDLNESQTDANLNKAALEIQNDKVVQSFTILTKSELWIGYINKTDNITKQGIIQESLALDPSKEWLLSLGHGHVDVEIDGEIQEFRSRNNIKFIYKDGTIKEITFTEFKALNEGRAW